MIKNYFKTTFRNLWKTRGYSFLNIFGLAVGITAASLIFLWVEDEMSYNAHFPDKENTYISKSKQIYEGVSYVFDANSGPLAPAVKAEIPGIQYAARAANTTPYVFTIGDNNMYQNGRFVDPDFMDIFSLEFVAGNRATAMTDVHNMIVTQATAERIFGKEPALGRTVRVNNSENYVITGVVKDLPKNSTYPFDWLIPFEAYESWNNWTTTWNNIGLLTFFQLEPTADLNEVNRKLYDFAIIKSGSDKLGTYNFLYPMERWRLYNSFDQNGNEQEGRIKYVKLFSIIAWVVLLIACINFMNLTTARSEKRAKEVGMRKVVGATKKSLIGQFLGESIILATLSALLAIGLAYFSIGAFNNLVEKELTIELVDPMHLAFLIGIVLICGLISGSYPAFYLSSFNPITTLKGAKQKAGAAGFIRRGLVVLQYGASIILIICTAIIFQQIQHVKGRDMGFDRSQVLTTQLRGDMHKHIDVIKNQLMATGNIEHVGLSNTTVLNIGNNTSGTDWAGKDPNSQVLVGFLLADADFIPAMDMKLIEGRNFRQGLLGDSTSVIINETFAKLIKPDGAVTGQTMEWNDIHYTIIGVVNDFVYNDMYAPSEPLFFHPFGSSSGVINIKTKAGVDLAKTVAQIEQIIKANNPGYPFEYDFLDNVFNEKFKSEMLIQRLAGVFAVLSIIISCLGLFGLAAFTAERRTKEMGIRKVLGASVSSLVGLLNREFVVLVLVSCALAFPLAWWIMSDWLGNYQYHTDLHWWVFALAGGGALVIALLTVSSQAIKAALTNPTKSLRDE
ncbi:ABC transporter permease [Parapedobacter koreensis]|uniref:Duplicated orphan permease n=1 Tax=Parapedobacter koreensis TaxID=332977 RepID=A0A1H7R304_9SPHI|nr:ABC transporter permease [Parapedobacter koreensis]SEL54563.1 duplicated orphan permease [Parapedobacter koreensis]